MSDDIVQNAKLAAVPLVTDFHRGVTDVSVDLIDWPTRPYRILYDMATATWTGGRKNIDKWDSITPEQRFAVVKAVLEFKSLPNAMEAFSFSFGIQGCSRSDFDQIARARVGAVFGSMGWRDLDHSDIGFNIPEAVWVDEETRVDFMQTMEHAKLTYHRAVAKGQHNWQNARAVMPIFAQHKFAASFSFMALRGFMAKRLKFCEQEGTVAVAWLMRERVREVFPLLAWHLMPGCDAKGRCDFHDADALSYMFKGCGRWPDPYADKATIFNESASDEHVIAQQTKLEIPSGPYAKKVFDDLKDWDMLALQDKRRFEGEG